MVQILSKVVGILIVFSYCEYEAIGRFIRSNNDQNQVKRDQITFPTDDQWETDILSPIEAKYLGMDGAIEFRRFNPKSSNSKKKKSEDSIFEEFWASFEPQPPSTLQIGDRREIGIRTTTTPKSNEDDGEYTLLAPQPICSGVRINGRCVPSKAPQFD